MEEAAEAERQKPARPYDDLPELPDALKEQLSSLLGTAAKLERDYQSVLDAAGTAAPASWLLPLGRLHAQWQADLTRFRAALQSAGVPQKSRDMVLPALERMAQQIGKLEARVQAVVILRGAASGCTPLALSRDTANAGSEKVSIVALAVRLRRRLVETGRAGKGLSPADAGLRLSSHWNRKENHRSGAIRPHIARNEISWAAVVGGCLNQCRF